MNGDTVFLILAAAVFVGVWLHTNQGGGSRLGKLLRKVDAEIEAAAWEASASDMAAGRRAELRRRLAETLDPKGDGPKS